MIALAGSTSRVGPRQPSVAFPASPGLVFGPPSARIRGLLERWMSGLSRTPGKRVWDNIPPRVRIPLSPPARSCKASRSNGFTFSVSIYPRFNPRRTRERWISEGTRMQRCLLALMAVAVSLSAHASLITTSAAGDLMFEYLGGEAGPSHQEFGIGTPSEDSSAADRNVVFVVDYTRPPVPVPVVNKGYYPAGKRPRVLQPVGLRWRSVRLQAVA
jgi:hypothetical protein